jgi:hypothetical protein
MAYDSLDAIMYVSGPATEDELSQLLARILGGQVGRFGRVITGLFNIMVSNNPDWELRKEWQYYVVIDVIPGAAAEHEVIAAMTNLLRKLWEMGMHTRTQVLYEDELPNAGCW